MKNEKTQSTYNGTPKEPSGIHKTAPNQCNCTAINRFSFEEVIHKEMDIQGSTRYQLTKDAGESGGWAYTILKNGNPNISTASKIAGLLQGRLLIEFPGRIYELKPADE